MWPARRSRDARPGLLLHLPTLLAIPQVLEPDGAEKALQPARTAGPGGKRPERTKGLGTVLPVQLETPSSSEPAGQQADSPSGTKSTSRWSREEHGRRVQAGGSYQHKRQAPHPALARQPRLTNQEERAGFVQMIPCGNSGLLRRLRSRPRADQRAVRELLRGAPPRQLHLPALMP